MRIGTILTAIVAVLALSLGSAKAQLKIGIVDLARAFNEQSETKDFTAKAETEGKQLQQTGEDKQTTIKRLQESMRDMKSDQPQYEETKKQIITKLVEFKAWQEIVTQDVQRVQKQQIKATFDKIQEAVKVVAGKKGLDLVLADSNPQIPANLDALNVDQLKGAIQQRNILFKSPSAQDITTEVITELDSKYAAEKAKK